MLTQAIPTTGATNPMQAIQQLAFALNDIEQRLQLVRSTITQVNPEARALVGNSGFGLTGITGIHPVVGPTFGAPLLATQWMTPNLTPNVTSGLAPGFAPVLAPGFAPGFVPNLPLTPTANLAPNLTPNIAPAFAPGAVPAFAPVFGHSPYLAPHAPLSQQPFGPAQARAGGVDVPSVAAQGAFVGRPPSPQGVPAFQ